MNTKWLLLAVILCLACGVAWATVQAISTRATCTYTDSDGVAMTPVDSNIVTLTVTRKPNLVSTLSVDKPNAVRGETVKFSLTVANTGDDLAKNVTVALSGITPSTPVTVNLGDIAAGTSKIATWTATVK